MMMMMIIINNYCTASKAAVHIYTGKILICFAASVCN